MQIVNFLLDHPATPQLDRVKAILPNLKGVTFPSCGGLSQGSQRRLPVLRLQAGDNLAGSE